MAPSLGVTKEKLSISQVVHSVVRPNFEMDTPTIQYKTRIYHYTNRPKVRNRKNVKFCKSVKWSRYRPGVAKRVGRGIALLFHDRGTRRGWVTSSTPRPQFTPGKGPVTIVQEAGWVPGPVWTGGKFRPHRHSIPERPAGSSVAIPTGLNFKFYFT